MKITQTKKHRKDIGKQHRSIPMSVAVSFIKANHIRDLNLYGCKILDAGCKIIASVLNTNWSLHSLDLSKNRITDKGIKYLCQALKYNYSLAALDLGSNLISDKGTLQLCNSINTISELGFTNNPITMMGCFYLYQCLLGHPFLVISRIKEEPKNDKDLIKNKLIASIIPRNQMNRIKTTQQLKEIVPLSRSLILLELPIDIKILMLQKMGMNYTEILVLLNRNSIGKLVRESFSCTELRKSCLRFKYCK
ncbi:hypothetical protein HDV06_001994 [Boothiomyces sp. JEL0866]|nr:hypothetical protein HDV06_001994 [Boothiomyces sp. JEL0866]